MGIYVWGTGCGAAELTEQGLNAERITAFVDSFPSGERFLDKPVLTPEQLPVEDCALMIVTTRHSEAVAQRCAELGLDAGRVLFLKNSCELIDRNAACSTAVDILGQALLSRLLPRQQVIAAPLQLRQPELSEDEQSSDYVRMATLELLCRRLREVPGAAAELGVYRGAFARCINQLLPERRLYLFDSFDGFDEEEAARYGASEAFQAALRNTAADRVLSVMPYPQQVLLRPGFFPASLEGLDERFCLVSLDADLRDTTLEGLRYFWPRLSPGAYLLLHDWGNPKTPGVSDALRQFEAELGTAIPAVPAADLCGSLILAKAN